MTVVSSGEQVTAGLLAMTLQAMGCKALVARLAAADPHRQRPCQGAHRDDGFARAAGLDGGGRDRGDPGLSGLVGTEDRVTTLGRGGSDTSAVAWRRRCKADRCDIYTDVDGVYTTDPRIVPRHAS